MSLLAGLGNVPVRPRHSVFVAAVDEHRSRWHLRTVTAFAATVATVALFGVTTISASAAFADTLAGPAIISDQIDYAPGSVVSLTGSGWGVTEVVHLIVNDDQGQTWSYATDTSSDSAGGFSAQFTLPTWFVASYTATATDASGRSASTKFTDSNVQVRAVAGTAQQAGVVRIGWAAYNESGDCTLTADPTGTADTLLNGYVGTTGIGTNHSGSFTAPGTITVSSGVYAFSGWSGAVISPADVTSGKNPVCIAGNSFTGNTQVTANYDHLVTKTAQTISFDQLAAKTFGAADFTVAATATASSGLPVSFSAGSGDQCTISAGGTVHLTGAGSCTVTASQGGDGTYAAAPPVYRTFTIAQQPILVTVTGTQTYGGSPTFAQTSTPPIIGLNVGSSALVCSKVIGDISITPLLDVAAYSIDPASCSGADLSGTGASNYVITYAGSAFTVNPKTITVTVTGTSIYGTAPHFEESSVTPTPITVTNSALRCSATTNAKTIDTSLPAGSYTIDPASCSGAGLSGTGYSNYVIAYAGGGYLVTKAELAVTVTGTQIYGGIPSFNQTSSPLADVTVDGSLLTCTAVTGTSISTTLAAGRPYVLDPASCSGAVLSVSDAANYDIAYVGGGFTVSPKPITVAVSGTQVYGGSPSYTPDYTSTEWVIPDDFSVVGGTLGCTAANGTSTRQVASYTILSCAGLGAGNYTIGYDYGTLSVTKRPVTITADPLQTKTYGDADPTLTYQITDGSLAFSDAFTGSLTRAAGENVGSYAITQGTVALNANYTLSYVGANLGITKRPVTITADPLQTKTYGDTDPTLTYQITDGSLAFSDAFTGSLTRAAGENVGPYAIFQGTVTLGDNYTLTYVGANLNIVYGWNGFLQPINDTAHQLVYESKFKLGQTIPAKFVLTDAFGNVVQQSGNPTFTRSPWRRSCDFTAALDSVPSITASTDPEYKLTGGQYLYGWSTKGLTAGEYTIFANLADGTARSVDICLTK